ncbi:MAG: hypothetical protein ACRET0_17190 [Steroidobacteraceae bacterium]
MTEWIKLLAGAGAVLALAACGQAQDTHRDDNLQPDMITRRAFSCC